MESSQTNNPFDIFNDPVVPSQPNPNTYEIQNINYQLEDVDLLGLGTDNNTAYVEPNGNNDEEQSDTKQIIVRYNGVDSPVSWYTDTPLQDILDAVMGACDCIIDSGFELVDPDGKTVDFSKLNELPSGKVYTLYQGKEKKELQKALGDRWRKIALEIEPLRHLEVQKAIEYMQAGANLLKHTNGNYPHIRQFQLSNDLKRILWYSGNKKIEKTQIEMATIIRVTLGQESKRFKKYPIPQVAHLSFTIYYTPRGTSKEESISLTCKDEFEFDMWVAGVRALAAHFQGRFISKMTLFSHSKKFNAFINQKKNISSSNLIFLQEYSTLGAASTDLTGVSSKTLEECIVRKAMSRHEFLEKLAALSNRIRQIKEEVKSTNEDFEHHIGEEAKGSGYTIVTGHEKQADDVLIQKDKMNEMMIKVNGVFEFMRKKYDADPGKDDPKIIKGYQGEIWKIEIDVENINDIIKRIRFQRKPSIKEKLKNIFPQLF